MKSTGNSQEANVIITSSKTPIGFILGSKILSIVQMEEFEEFSKLDVY